MCQRFPFYLVFALAVGLFMTACGGSPTTPPPPPPPPPPVNALPVIDGITVQGRRAGQPARFADVRETVDVAATVSDAETPIDELIYQWTATAGTFTGTGRNMTWTAPETAATPPGSVTITLKVIENYGHPGQPKNFTQDVSRTQTLALHDSATEVGGMVLRFLTEFSKPQTNQNVDDIMRDFKAAACPQPSEVDEERKDVIDHYENVVMNRFKIGVPAVSVRFGGACDFRSMNLVGDACAITPVDWDSTDRRFGHAPTQGRSHISAAYSTSDSRWWLCGSHYEPFGTVSHPFYSR